MKSAVEQNKNSIPWIISHYNNGAEVASLCIGAFLLASTGLLKNKKRSTHGASDNEFRETFPDVDIQEGRIITKRTEFIQAMVQIHTGTCFYIY